MMHLNMMRKKIYILIRCGSLQVICALCDTEQEVSGGYVIPSLHTFIWS